MDKSDREWTTRNDTIGFEYHVKIFTIKLPVDK